MAKRVAEVRTEDLSRALDLLEGVEHILRRFSEGDRGRDQRPQLALSLLDMDSVEDSWESLRYEDANGMGWGFMADNTADLRGRLPEGYGNAAL